LIVNGNFEGLIKTLFFKYEKKILNVKFK